MKHRFQPAAHFAIFRCMNIRYLIRKLGTVSILLIAGLVIASCDSLPSVSLPDFSSATPAGERGIPIVSIDPGTEAARQGMQAGDIIVEVNGDDIYTKDNLVRSFGDTGRFFRANRVTALRDGKEMRFSIRTNLQYSGIVTKSSTGIMPPRKDS
tara:strand:- start:61 stop:522 length:462 start_codon:yes stop_codon:yes gene_type:complete